jgi:DNA-binding transcriptional MerR regulator
MLKIGDFSRLSQVSVKTLRYYDEVALLKPTQVDEVSGYRYYAVAQLRHLHRILALRDLGFSLDQIGYVLEADLSIEELRGMLRLRRAEQQQRLLEEQERLDRVEALLQLIHHENTVNTDTVQSSLFRTCCPPCLTFFVNRDPVVDREHDLSG